MKFAENTSVPVERSRAEIEKLIVRYGATSTAFMTTPGRAMIAFEANNRKVAFELPLPSIDEKAFARDGRGSARTPQKRYEAWEQACRQRWRALALVIKAKLEAVASGITTFEQEFFAHILLPNGQSVYHSAKDQVAKAYQSGQVRNLLPDYTERKSDAAQEH